VSARAQNRGQQVANGMVLVRGDNRNRTANVGLTHPLYRAAVPDQPLTPRSYDAGPSGFEVASNVNTLRGFVRRFVDRTQVKTAVARATTANLSALSGTVSVDGANATNGSRVLVKNQTTAANNGIYVVNTSGAWTRATDADGGTELDQASVFVTSGTVNAGTIWQQVTEPVTIGTTAQTWQRRPVFGLRESERGGPVTVSYGLSLANWYNGACTIEQGGALLAGTRVAPSGTVTLDNGLVRVSVGSVLGIAFLIIDVASGSPLAWQNGTGSPNPINALFFGGDPLSIGFSTLSILANSADQVTLRSRFTGGAMDVGVTRGCRTVSLSFTFARNNRIVPLSFPALTAGWDFSAPEAGSGTGFTSAANSMIYADADDAFGNRFGMTYAGTLTTGTFNTVTGPWTPSARSHQFGLHAVVGGGSTKTGDDQLYGLSREWFGLISQQTSAGVL
jgi:hypothetical protein